MRVDAKMVPSCSAAERCIVGVVAAGCGTALWNDKRGKARCSAHCCALNVVALSGHVAASARHYGICWRRLNPQGLRGVCAPRPATHAVTHCIC